MRNVIPFTFADLQQFYFTGSELADVEGVSFGDPQPDLHANRPTTAIAVPGLCPFAASTSSATPSTKPRLDLSTGAAVGPLIALVVVAVVLMARPQPVWRQGVRRSELAAVSAHDSR